MKQITFTDEHGSFLLKQPENTNYLYFPLASEKGLKSSVTPLFNGDAKLDQETFLLEPVSSENLHNNRSTRNFWCAVDESGIFSATGASAGQEAARFSPDQDETELSAGFQWQTVTRFSKILELESTVTSFVPVDCNVEILHVTIKNRAKDSRQLTPYGAIPIYGRSADNIRDHRNVTSMLHRIETTEDGILVCPTMSFDEKGHRPNHKVYYVLGCSGDGTPPTSFYPTVESFIGEGGFYTHPQAVHDRLPGVSAGTTAAGREAMGAFRFETITLGPEESADYILLLGVEDAREDISDVLQKYNSSAKVEEALCRTKTYWQKSVNAAFHTGDTDFDKLMKWVCFQPFLRRLFGCSFLPHHDYGRGGRGWRDLWQDCLSLLLLEPKDVGRMIAMNYGGVRIDGTNATIIGAGDGNFIADRNGIARVWMDHALWPQMTTKLYIDQTGDVEILNREVPYFKDAQTLRGTDTDTEWSPDQGSNQRTKNGEVYTGTILEHLLIQQLAAFYEVGDHNIYRLRGADWNDALDMAAEHGESVAFTCAYAGNLLELAALLRLLEKHSDSPAVSLLEEISILLVNDPAVYDDADKKRKILSDYVNQCRHEVSGKRGEFSLATLAVNLTEKANWLMEHLRSQEWISVSADEGWYNSYYDDHGKSVDGVFEGKVRMMLTGQVFSIMSGVADNAQIGMITKSADHYLYQKESGGYRLNTDFEELKFDMGRMFGFAYGEKENGAVFSHMTVMYANALYRRGFVQEGWKALKTLADTALDFDTSHIYPGIPEYFRADGRGMYHYLTGAASWYMLTLITEVFGVRGEAGDLLLDPKLLGEQFDADGCASVSIPFAGKDLTVIYRNRERKDFGSYIIGSAVCDKEKLSVSDDAFLILPRETIEGLSDGPHEIMIELV
ncbi:MAG: cellobiose phosphorylase [Lachnospiraceae bacterium]|nr:cellobiose phosphorylase [Lachnospiraceae bacterium]